MRQHFKLDPEDKVAVGYQEDGIALAHQTFRALLADSSLQHPSFSWYSDQSLCRVIFNDIERLEAKYRHIDSIISASTRTRYFSDQIDSPVRIACCIQESCMIEFLGVTYNFEGPLPLYYINDERKIDYFCSNQINQEYIYRYLRSMKGTVEAERDYLNLDYFKSTLKKIVENDLNNQKMSLAIQEAVLYNFDNYLDTIETVFDATKIVLTAAPKHKWKWNLGL